MVFWSRAGCPLSSTQGVRSANLPQIAESAHEVVRFHLRAADVAPRQNRILIDRASGTIASPQRHVPRDDLHVEDPSREKRPREHLFQYVIRPEDLRTALRVVDGQSE